MNFYSASGKCHLTYLGRQLAHHGIEPAANLVIRDQPDDIRTFFADAWKRSDLIITTGGLGPTSDDLTRETIAEVLGEELIYDAEVENAIRERFRLLERPMPESNNRQSYRPASAEVLSNPYGTAPGLYLKKDGKILVMLPGPAREMHPMFEQLVVPKLQAEECFLKLIATCNYARGIGESALAEKVEPMLKDKPGLVVGYCAHAGMVDLRLSSLDSDILSEEELHKIGDDCRKNWVKTLPVLAAHAWLKLFSANYDPWIKHSPSPNHVRAVCCPLISQKFPAFPKFFREVPFATTTMPRCKCSMYQRVCSNSTEL